MRLIVSFLALFACLRAGGANHYFDITNNGAATGASWDNAWTNSGGVAWGSINPGDNIYFSGATPFKVYANSNFVFQENGTWNNPITLKIGQDAGHNGKVWFSNACIKLNGATAQWNWIDGAINPSFVAPTNHQQVEAGSTAISNNIGFRMGWMMNAQGGPTTNTSVTDPLIHFITEGADYLKWSWVEMDHMTNWSINGDGRWVDYGGTVVYIDVESMAITNMLMEYCWLHDNRGQQITVISQTNNAIGFEFKYGIVERGGEDHFETSTGVSIHDSVIGPALSHYSAHNDHLQLQGNGPFHIYNNKIWESYNGVLRLQSHNNNNPLSTQYAGNLLFYNNLVLEKPGHSVHGGTFIEPFSLVHVDPFHPIHMIIWSNVVFANNLFYRSLTNYTTNNISTPTLAQSSVIYFARGAQVTNAIVKNSLWVNNLVVDKQKGVSWFNSTNVDMTGGVWPHTTNDSWADYNTQANTNLLLEDPMAFNYMDENVLDGSSPFLFSNLTNYPSWVDKDNYNFELAANDISALNKGYNMSSLFTYDALNRPRGTLWSRGPLESDAGLAIHYSFENDTHGGNATDDTGNGYTGTRFQLAGYINSYPSNRLASALAGTLYRPNVSGDAMEFLWRTNNGVYNPTYGRVGGYFAATNAYATLSNTTELTVLVWAAYNSLALTDLDPLTPGYSYAVGANEALIVGGGIANATLGSWYLGRYNSQINLNETRVVIHTNAGAFTPSWGSYGDRTFGNSGRVVFNLGDTGSQNSLGKTTNLAHYGFVWNNGVCKSYYNGLFWGTNDMSGVLTSLRLGSGLRAYDVVAIGANPHVGTPEFDNETGTAGDNYPNQGFLNGVIDEPMIWLRALTLQEIIDIANNQGAEFADAPAEGGGSEPSGGASARAKFRGLRIR